jgi:3'-5' exoribonuclease
VEAAVSQLQEIRPAVADLRPGQRLEGRFACVAKERQTARNGSTYLSLRLRDRTGTIPARAFRDADRIGLRFDAGDAIVVRGRVERYRGELVIEVDDVRRIDPGRFDPAEFLPSAYRSAEELEGFLEHLAREIHDPPLRATVDAVVFGGPLAADFRRAPCTRGSHHAYRGDLLEHTVAVATLALETCTLHPRLNSDLLITAALVHDLGKLREFTYGAEIGLSEEGRLLGHVVLGQQLLEPRLAGMSAERRIALLHCVLTHHGADGAPGRRFGSPEALALHRLNALDASVKGALEHGLP